jgi:hypothetical protein
MLNQFYLENSEKYKEDWVDKVEEDNIYEDDYNQGAKNYGGGYCWREGSRHKIPSQILKTYENVWIIFNEINIYYKDKPHKTKDFGEIMKFSPYLMGKIKPEDCGYKSAKLSYNPL